MKNTMIGAAANMITEKILKDQHLDGVIDQIDTATDGSLKIIIKDLKSSNRRSKSEIEGRRHVEDYAVSADRVDLTLDGKIDVKGAIAFVVDRLQTVDHEKGHMSLGDKRDPFGANGGLSCTMDIAGLTVQERRSIYDNDKQNHQRHSHSTITAESMRVEGTLSQVSSAVMDFKSEVHEALKSDLDKQEHDLKEKERRDGFVRYQPTGIRE